MPPESVVEAQVKALEQLTEAGFKNINKRLDHLVSNDKFEAYARRVERVETKQDQHDTRLDTLERVSYLLGIIGTVAMVVLGALAVAIATGRLQMVWK